MAIKLLIVDDSFSIRAFVKKTLTMIDLEIDTLHEASDGLQALEVLEKEAVDVILTDINMPNMNGLELIKKIRAQTRFDNIKIVVISTEGSREMVVEAMKCGANKYLKKPFGPEQAMETLEESLKS
jgi:two-component system chemotaxis response regulator CheY